MELAKKFGLNISNRDGKKILNIVWLYAAIWMFILPILLRMSYELYWIRIVFMDGVILGAFIFLMLSSFLPRELTSNPGKDKTSQYITHFVYYSMFIACLACLYFIAINFFPETKFLHRYYNNQVETKVIEATITKTYSEGYNLPYISEYNVDNYPNKLNYYLPVPIGLRLGEHTNS
jgi:hypothetical protein